MGGKGRREENGEEVDEREERRRGSTSSFPSLVFLVCFGYFV